MDTSRSTILRKIATRELRRLNKLSNEELFKEAIEWFQETWTKGTREEVTNDLLEDFMQYRENEPTELLIDTHKENLIRDWFASKPCIKSIEETIVDIVTRNEEKEKIEELLNQLEEDLNLE